VGFATGSPTDRLGWNVLDKEVPIPSQWIAWNDLFCEPDGSEKLPVFSVGVNGDQTIGELNFGEKAGGVRRGYVLEATSVRIRDEGNLRIDLGPKTGKTVLSGINLRRANQ
jgi:hypothetical protein